MQRTLLDILGDDQQGNAARLRLIHLQEGKQGLGIDQPPLGEQQIAILEDGLAAGAVETEERRQEAALDLQALRQRDSGFRYRRGIEREIAFQPGAVDGLGNDAAHLGVAVGGNGGDGADLVEVVLGDRLGENAQGCDNAFDRQADAALQGLRIGSGRDLAIAFGKDGAGKDGGGGGAVSGLGIGALGDFLDELRALVFVGIGQGEGAGDGDAVLGDLGGAERASEDDGLAARAEGGADRVGDFIHAAQQGGAGFFTEQELTGHG